jgi:UDP-N-acetyl-D-glucosamine dehydrogenase
VRDASVERVHVSEAVMSQGTLVVIGVGYVGLPLALEAGRAGWRVVGLEMREDVVDCLRSGRSHVDDVSDLDVRQMLASGFDATTDKGVIGEADVVVICVPTPLGAGGEPDLGAVRSAAGMVAEHIGAGMLVVLESTTYPGTTDELIRPLLESDDLKAGVDFHLAFSPERIDPGNPRFGLRNTPKVVGGVTTECTERAAAFYGSFVDEVVLAHGSREAETAKLLENTYRHINIALVNEMARFCHELDIDLWDVIRCAGTKPFGFQAFYPGPGVGGHCIPIDPNYLSYRVKTELGYPFRFVELAEEVNASMPAYVASRVQSLLNDQRRPLNGSTILLLGVTYKPDISDQRESPAVPLAKILRQGGAEVHYVDPFVDDWAVDGEPVPAFDDLADALAAADVSVLVQDHASFGLDDLATEASCLLDTRGVVPAGPGVHRL